MLVDHCVRSNAGLFYADRDEFVEALRLLLIDEQLRAAMGRNGRDYIRKYYRWDVIMAKYDRLLAKIERCGNSELSHETSHEFAVGRIVRHRLCASACSCSVS